MSITTRDGREYLIPNEDLITTQVVNWSHSNDFVRLDIYFGTAYGDNPHDVRKLAIEAAASVDRVLEHRPPFVISWALGIRPWITSCGSGSRTRQTA